MGEATVQAFADTAKPGASLYAWSLPRSMIETWQATLKELGLLEAYVDLDIGRPDDQLTTIVDVSAFADKRWEAIQAHKTQTSPFHGLPPELRARFFAADCYVRLVPAWDGGPVETRLFDAT
jgi:LmbE family N-acetylglucosaminyl deacetylase